MERAPHGRRSRRTWIGGFVAALAAGALSLTWLTGTAQAADIDVAKNAGFESGLANWTCSAGSGATVGSPVHGGTAALRGRPPGRTTPSARRQSPYSRTPRTR